MAARLPFWYGQPRGAGLASLTLLEPEPGDDEPGFLDKVLERLFGGLTDTRAAFIGFTLPLLVLVFATASAAPQAPAAAVFLGLATATWLVLGAVCARLVAVHGDEAPPWARYAVHGLAGFGRIVLFAVIIGSIVAVLIALMSVLVAASADRR
jgi:hypothetical protein